jgi:glycosyltransferase involved in cell wall biosynthesis
MWFQLTNIDLISRELSACDVVHGQDIYAFPLLQLFKRRRLKTPWVVTFHTNPQAELYFALNSVIKGSSLTDLVTYGAAFPLWDLTVRQHSKHADSLVCVSGSLREELSRGYKLDLERLKVIHTCASINEARMHEASKSLRSSTGTVRLFYAGRLYYRKGILKLIQIMADIVNQPEGRNISLNVFGRGPLELVLKKYVADHLRKISVAIRGHVDRATLLQELSKSDIVCFPSLYEACPMLMIEAISMGKPVLAFDLPFAREILGNIEELLAIDTDDFRLKLIRLISSQNERLGLGRRILKRSRDFDALKIAAEYRKVYEELI